MPRKSILWDFEGTLVRRRGGWKKVLAEVLMEQQLASDLTSEQIHSFFSGNWPWNFPEHPHPHLTTAEVWWREIEERVLVPGYNNLGFPLAQARQLAQRAHQKYVDPAGWFIYEDVILALDQLKRQGWGSGDRF